MNDLCDFNESIGMMGPRRVFLRPSRLSLFLTLVLSAYASRGDAQTGRTANIEQVERWMSALRDDDSYRVRLKAAILLGHAGSQAPEAVFRRCLHHDVHAAVRAACATASGSLGDLDLAADLLKVSVLDEDALVRSEAGRILKGFERTSTEAKISALFESPDHRIRVGVVRWLGLGTTQSSLPILVRALGDGDDVFDAANQALMSSRHWEKVGALALKHPEASVRRGLARHLGARKSKAALAMVLQIFFRDLEEESVRRAAKDAIRASGELLDLKLIAPDLEQREDKHRRSRALRLLGVAQAPGAMPYLLTALEDSDPYIRGTAVMAATDLGDPRILPKLESMLEDPKNARITLLVKSHVEKFKRQKRSSSP